MTSEGEILWEPSQQSKENSNIAMFERWLQDSEKKLNFKNYSELHNWSISQVSDFWESIFNYFQVGRESSYKYVVNDEKTVFGADWFPGARVNYTERVFRNRDPSKTALVFRNERGGERSLSWSELEREVAAISSSLRELGVKNRDRIAALVPNIPEAIEGLLACASVGAIWSSCSPEFGIPSIVDRFSQIEPKVLLGVDAIRYNGKMYEKLEVLRNLEADLPSIQKTILIETGLEENEKKAELDNSVTWGHLLDTHSSEELKFQNVPFNHPLWILYSSGTTGLPKPIVHSHGGILLEHLKVLSLHQNVKPEDRFFWYTTTGWMMWNYLTSGLLLDSTVVLYDGNPMYPRADSLWQMADEVGVTIFGTSAAYIAACAKAGLSPLKHFELNDLESVSSTGSPLSADGFEYLYENVKKDLWVASVSGGTDLCTAFLGGCSLLPVTAGEIQCICLGADVRALDESGRPVVNETGELVIVKPMPSMPVFFWGDSENKRYLESYFSTFPGVWRHGDWIRITDRGTCQIYGRSDSTIKRLGLRMGTSEIYRAVESLQEIQDSIAVDVGVPGKQSLLILFVVIAPGRKLDHELEEKLRERISTNLSPRFIPDRIVAVPEVPKTLNGKKMEVPVKKILLGIPAEKALSVDSMANPKAIEFYRDVRRNLHLSG